MSSQRSFNKYIFYDQTNVFLQNEYIFKKDLYFICNIKNSAWKCISQMKLLFYIFIYIFLWKKRFFSKKIFQYKTFFSYKNIFSANNSYIFKNRYIFSKKYIFFFNLDLQQMGNHSWLPEFSDLGLIGLVNSLTNIEPMLHF